MSMNKLYVDGCSHTVGHDPAFNVGKDYLTSLFVKELEEERVIEAGTTAKCNEAIFFDFLNCFDILQEGDSVLIYWSHAERITQHVQNVSRANLHANLHHKKYLNGIIGYKNLDPTPYSNNKMYKYTQLEDLAWTFLYRTYMQMYAVQELCKSKGINYYFMTVDPYYKYQLIPKEYRKQAPVDESKVFNWPMPEIALWHNFNRNKHSNFLVEWALTSTPILLGRALTKENKSQYIAQDYKHLKQKGHRILYQWITEWMDNSDRDLQWIINNKLTHEAAREFNTLEFHIKEFNLKGFNAVHWVEQEVDLLVKQLTPAITYVYE